MRRRRWRRGAGGGEWCVSSSGDLRFEPNQEQQGHHEGGPEERDSDDHTDPEALGGISQCGRRQQAADEGEGKNSVEEAGVVIREAAADGLGDERIDAGIPRAEEEDAGTGAECVVREKEDEAAEEGGENAAQKQLAVADTREY